MLIFDLDGTIIDSAEDVCDSFNQTIEEMGLAPIEAERLLACVGTGIQPLLQEIFSDSESKLKKALELFDKIFVTNLTNKTRVYEGIDEVWNHFDGIPKVILTNKRQRYADITVDDLGIRKHFTAVYGRDAFDKCKPDPLPIEKILEVHSGQKEKTWMIGDSFTDIRAGKSAGVRTCGVLYGYTSRDDILAENADVYVESPRELIDILCNL